MATPIHAEPVELTTPGPEGDLRGTYLAAGAPIVLIVPGSGPTDRDGNNPFGIRASTYRLIAEGLAERGISSVRVDKRGMFGSAAAVPDANSVTIADYAADVGAWVNAIRVRSGSACVWLLGHSEGVLVALAAAQKPDGICGLLLVSAAGRPMGAVLRGQLQASGLPAPAVEPAFHAIEALEAGEPVDIDGLDPSIAPLFAPQIQGFLRSVFAVDPALLIAGLDLPVLILHGRRDIQVLEEDAMRLKRANDAAELTILPEANHVLKSVVSDDRAANLAAYSDPGLPLATGVIDALAGFVLREHEVLPRR